MISVIVPVLNEATVIEAQLAALGRQTYDGEWELVIADNGCSDGTMEIVGPWADRLPRLKIVDASAHAGPAAARNAGAAAAAGDVLAFCDADDVVDPRWLEVCALTLKVTSVMAGSIDFASLNGRPPEQPSYPLSGSLTFLPAGLGANLAISRRAFNAVGGFDEALRAGEDVDLCWRLQLGGWTFRFEPAAIVCKRARRGRLAQVRQEFNYGRHNPALYQRFRSRGMSRGAWTTVKVYGWLLVNAPLAPFSNRGEVWLRVLGERLGRVVGSIEHKVLYL